MNGIKSYILVSSVYTVECLFCVGQMERNSRDYNLHPCQLLIYLSYITYDGFDQALMRVKERERQKVKGRR
jgi:hypothetical protein